MYYLEPIPRGEGGAARKRKLSELGSATSESDWSTGITSTALDSVVCFISADVFHSPVLSPDTGHTYERWHLVKWLTQLWPKEDDREGQMRQQCPLTRAPLSVSRLVPNRAFQDAIDMAIQTGETSRTHRVIRNNDLKKKVQFGSFDVHHRTRRTGFINTPGCCTEHPCLVLYCKRQDNYHGNCRCGQDCEGCDDGCPCASCLRLLTWTFNWTNARKCDDCGQDKWSTRTCQDLHRPLTLCSECYDNNDVCTVKADIVNGSALIVWKPNAEIVFPLHQRPQSREYVVVMDEDVD